ncbi:aerobic respiration two-component sensor histidine kinase ArcB [Vibrio sp. UCD-FRSSP16_10]|uniref:aerobic respiration two-component sensor histidine kinase ArcB n=1 Tax=unclassified Vibrio TaxID=2614977 RepID=UPI0007FC7572|nr:MULTISPECIES: aerobic respiration two-component sensor histidine kinase ArcB [unclassified Vibrio]OBT07323.1 aerobic respiration two-component sensor histidine kinase ArcB [Vibrio sp. UCD-FRSSP16_30]OBT12802.1 aerobic respiration two-component sensor histidine kinase ArcB [Vibrio sp. UCD-FRSSP16_10]
MKQLKTYSQYYVDLLVRLGIYRFSFLIALALIFTATMVQVGFSWALGEAFEYKHALRSLAFGLIMTPCAVYFISIVVEQLEESRRQLSTLVSELSELRDRDLELNNQLKQNLHKLNLEMKERLSAEDSREQAMLDLEHEVIQREVTQIALAERTALLRSFIDACPDLFYYRTANGVFSGCNQAVEKLTGKKEKELVGLTPWQVYKKEIAQQIVETDQVVFENKEELIYEQWLEYPDGRKAYFELRKVPFFDKDSHYLGLVGFGRDITERKLNEKSLEKASRDKTTFISTISHELRTPLNGIVGLSRMLLGTSLDKEQRQYMQTINVSAITLGHIFNDIIDIDKFDRNKLELVPTELNFNEFVTELDSLSRLMAEQKSLRFELERLTNMPDSIVVDATRLRQVLWNLISNAMKFTADGGVFVNVSAEAVENNQISIRFEIEDTGVGIPESELDKIFAMYYQVKSEEGNLHAVGTGIGLAVSQSLVRKMGGEIYATSELGHGSTFYVEMTVPRGTGVIEEHEAEEPLQRPLSIFMIEDIELNITVARSLITSFGHKVDVAMTGKEALSKFEPADYDLVLLDIQLPDMTGFDIANELQNRYTNLPPIVALTANLVKDKTAYIEAGMQDAISKPLSAKALRKILNKLCYLDEQVIEEKSHATKAVLEDSHLDIVSVDELIDKDMLRSYIEIVGKKPVLDSVQLFKDMMPDYVAILDSNLVAKDQDAIVSEAHKIKGAAGSVGLKRVQMVAQQAQSPELPAWWENIHDWIDEIKDSYLSDINVLKDWIEQEFDK